MDYVLDATIALKWSFEEVFSDRANLLLPRLVDGTDQAFAPALLLAEVGHNLRKRRFQKNLVYNKEDYAKLLSERMTTQEVEG